MGWIFMLQVGSLHSALHTVLCSMLHKGSWQAHSMHYPWQAALVPWTQRRTTSM